MTPRGHRVPACLLVALFAALGAEMLGVIHSLPFPAVFGDLLGPGDHLGLKEDTLLYFPLNLLEGCCDGKSLFHFQPALQLTGAQGSEVYGQPWNMWNSAPS